MQYHRISTMNNSSRQEARAKLGLLDVIVHDIRATYANRLRAVGMSQEGRLAFLGHACKSMAKYYVVADIGRLIKLSNRVLQRYGPRTVVSVANA